MGSVQSEFLLVARRSRLSRTGSIVSAFFNVWLLNGNPDESISARCYREGVIIGKPKWEKWHNRIDKLFFWEKEHCMNAYLVDLKHARELVHG